jgi:hypothetical protein
MSDSRVVAAWQVASRGLVSRSLWLLALTSLSWVACSAVIDTDKRKLGALPIACEPGQSAPCPCRDGTMSSQRCNELARYDRCACEMPESGDVPLGGASSIDDSVAGGQTGKAGKAGQAGHAGVAGVTPGAGAGG